MNTDTSKFVVSLKKTAKKLNQSFELVIKTEYPFYQAPSYQQCLEILSRAYGFNTFKGLKDNFNQDSFKFISKESEIKEMKVSFLQLNLQHHSNFIKKMELVISQLLLDKIIGYVYEVNHYLLDSYKFLDNFYFPKYLYSKNIKLNKLIIDEYRVLTEMSTHWLLSLLIEKFETYEIYDVKGKKVIDIPISFFYKNEITDWDQSRSLIIDLEDLINPSKVVRVAAGKWDFINFHNSRINIYLSDELTKNIIDLNARIKIKDKASFSRPSSDDISRKVDTDQLISVLNDTKIHLNKLSEGVHLDKIDKKLYKQIISICNFSQKTENIKNIGSYSLQNEIIDEYTTNPLTNAYRANDGLMLIGRSGTGKTTIIEKIISNQDYIIKSTDDIHKKLDSIINSTEYIKYIALDEIENFDTIDVVKFLHVCTVRDIKFFISIQNYEQLSAHITLALLKYKLKVKRVFLK